MSDVFEVEDLSETQFTYHADTTKISTSVTQCLQDRMFGFIKQEEQQQCQPDTDNDTSKSMQPNLSLLEDTEELSKRNLQKCRV